MKQLPHRKCLATGESLPKAELLRFVAGPDGKVWFDATQKAPGRGAYTVPTQAALQKAMQKKGLSKWLNAQVPADLAEQVTTQLTKQAVQALSLAKKAGKTAIGLDEVQKTEKKGRIVGLVLAADAGNDVQKKTQSIQAPKCTFLQKEQLEKALNVANTSVVGLTDAQIWHTLQRAEAFIHNAGKV